MSGMATAHGFMNRMYPNEIYGQYGNTVRSGLGFGSHAYDSQTNGHSWLALDNKYKPRGRVVGFFGYGNENMHGLNELNRGPRAKSSKNQKELAPVTAARMFNPMTVISTVRYCTVFSFIVLLYCESYIYKSNM